MAILLKGVDPKRLRVDETGTIRVGSSRVTLDVLLADYQRGVSPEEIVREMDTLNLADVQAAIDYYLHHRDEINDYLKQRREEADELRKKIEASQPDRANLKAVLIARMTSRNGDHASPAQYCQWTAAGK